MSVRIGRESLPALLGALPALILFTAWTADDGGYAPTSWYGGAVGLLFLLVVVVSALGERRRAPHAGLVVALAALAAYTAWSYASIAWADSRGDALEGANRTLLYLLVTAVFAALPWTKQALKTALAGFLLAMGAVAVVTILRVAAAGDPLPYFANARLTAPLGYQNAAPIAWTLAALPALVLASLRETPVALRAALLGLTAVFVELGLVSQSRTWFITLPALLLIALVLTPARLRLLLAAIPAAVATAITSPTLLAVYNQSGGGPADFRTEPEIAHLLASNFDAAARAMLISAIAVAAVGAGWALVDRRVELGSATRRRLARGGAAAAVICTLGGLAAAVALVPKGLDAIDEFRAGPQPADAGGSRLSSLGSSRWDFWSVALDLWKQQPVTGLGQDNFAAHYLPRADSGERPRWTHSLQLRLLTHTGLVGLLLFAAFAGGLLAALWAARRALAPPGRAVLAAASMPLAVWLLAGSVDWFWEVPALSAPALAFAAAAATLAPARKPLRVALPARATAATGAFAALAALLVLGAPWLAARHTERALELLPDVPAARQHLGAALDLNPWTARPALVQGLIAVRLGQEREAVRAFEELLRREPQSWIAELQLGALASARGERSRAESHLRRAARLNPEADVIAGTLQAARAGERVDLLELNRELRAGEEQLTAR